MPEVLGTMWFSRTFERCHSQTETELRPAPIVPFRYIQNICGGVQRTSWRRLVCGKINHSVRPVPSSAPVLAPCLWETQTPFIQISPCTAQSWLSQLYCVSVCALFLRSKATIIVASCPLNECTRKSYVVLSNCVCMDSYCAAQWFTSYLKV